MSGYPPSTSGPGLGVHPLGVTGAAIPRHLSLLPLLPSWSQWCLPLWRPAQNNHGICAGSKGTGDSWNAELGALTLGKSQAIEMSWLLYPGPTDTAA